MKKIKILLAATLFLSLISCSSDDENILDENPQVENCKISTITYGFFSGNRVYSATYNGDNLTQLTSSVDYVVFTYNSQNHLIKKEFYNNGNSQVQFKSEFTTNSSGQIIEQKNWEFYSGSLQYTGKETFAYNGNKISEIVDYYIDDATIQGKLVYEWTGNNPTKLSVYDENNVLECENTITYDLTKENKFNSTFSYFSFQDIYDEDFNLYQFLGENVITNTTNSCSGDTDIYDIILQSNGLVDNVELNNDLLWEFEYNCE